MFVTRHGARHARRRDAHGRVGVDHRRDVPAVETAQCGVRQGAGPLSASRRVTVASRALHRRRDAQRIVVVGRAGGGRRRRAAHRERGLFVARHHRCARADVCDSSCVVNDARSVRAALPPLSQIAHLVERRVRVDVRDSSWGSGLLRMHAPRPLSLQDRAPRRASRPRRRSCRSPARTRRPPRRSSRSSTSRRSSTRRRSLEGDGTLFYRLPTADVPSPSGQARENSTCHWPSGKSSGTSPSASQGRARAHTS